MAVFGYLAFAIAILIYTIGRSHGYKAGRKAGLTAHIKLDDE
jgi:hypothetical protein